VEELLEGRDIEDLVAGGLRSVDNELLGNLRQDSETRYWNIYRVTVVVEDESASLPPGLDIMEQREPLLMDWREMDFGELGKVAKRWISCAGERVVKSSTRQWNSILKYLSSLRCRRRRIRESTTGARHYDLDAVVEELLEGRDIEDLVASGLRSVDNELLGNLHRGSTLWSSRLIRFHVV
jgi:hypothetical protein